METFQTTCTSEGARERVLLQPLEIENGTLLNGSQILNQENIVHAEVKNQDFQEIQNGARVSHIGGVAIIKETQEISSSESPSRFRWPSEVSPTRHDEFNGHLEIMKMQGLMFELPVTSVLRATKFRPFKKKLCTPINYGTSRMTNPHMRGFWFAMVSFFLAFFGWFSVAPMLVRIREDIRICDNQNDIDDETICTCTLSCKQQIGNAKVASSLTTAVARLILGGFLERYGPKNVQCALLAFGALSVASFSVIQDLRGLLVCMIFIAPVGATFVANQFWMPLLFSPEILGFVNGTAAGWGNLGGGIANLVMPLFEVLTKNWRTAFLIPAAMMLLFSVFMFFCSQDTPMGPIVVERDLKKRKTSVRDYLRCILDYRVCILAIQYGACFGAETVMYWELASHFHDYFGMSLIYACWVSFGFGGMNIFARPLGGYFSDFLYEKKGLRGRLLAQFLCLFFEGLCLFVFGCITSEQGWVKALIFLALFSLFTQAAEGCTFSLVPYVQQENLGIVSAITGSSGNIFAALVLAVFYKNIPDYLLPFKLHAIFVLLSALLTFFIHFKFQGSLLSQPKLAKYCCGSFFSYVLEWELQFDCTYHVVGSYLSPGYKGILFKLDRKENYVKVAKTKNIEYGEGLVGAVGKTRKHCMVEMISEELTNITNNDMIEGLTEDKIQSVLYFSSEDGRRVIEVGGSNRYHLVEGVKLSFIERILAGKGRSKNLGTYLRKVNLEKDHEA